MIELIFPKDFPRYAKLPILGPFMDTYSSWLHEHQYTTRSIRYELRMVTHVCNVLTSFEYSNVEQLGEKQLHVCHQYFRENFPKEAGSVKTLTNFLVECNIIEQTPVTTPNPMEIHLDFFVQHLLHERGFVAETAYRHHQIIMEFLTWLNFTDVPLQLELITINDIDRFLIHLGHRMNRVSLQKPTGIIRNYLKFLVAEGIIPSGIENQVVSPRVYRKEKIPRALPWETVQAFLFSIDRSTPIGKRDFALFILMSTYGLRACDLVTLKLDDIDWKAEILKIFQTKTGKYLELPLTHEVISAIYDYLRNVPRYGKYRHLFLRMKAPGGTLKSGAVTSAFKTRVRKSNLNIPFKGAHCLRHSFATHLLRQNFPLKTIGDLLGHSSPESTGIYISLATEDLREVALNIPMSSDQQEGGQS